MAIGTTPIIPLNRIQANPDARFLRFGLNDSQLFGKPLVSLPNRPPPPEPQKPTQRPEPIRKEPKDTREAAPGIGNDLGKSPATLDLAATYSGRAGPVPVPPPSLPKPGSFLDVTA